MKCGRRRVGLLSFLTTATPILAVTASAFAPAPAPGTHGSVDEALVLPGPVVPGPVRPPPVAPAEHTFRLRHIFHHGAYQHPTLHRRRDVVETEIEPQVWLAAEDEHEREALGPLKVRSSPLHIERMVDRRPSVVDPMIVAAREQGFFSAMAPSAWNVDETPGPDITNKETVLNLALMAADAYVENDGEAEWVDVGKPFNRSADFGWQGDGLRGHIFADEDNSTVVIGLKGTSMAVFDGEGTTTNDKINDNLFFSCCCGQQGQWTWHQVCDCATSTYACNTTCVTQALRDEHRYYAAARELYSNVTELYPDANIWLSGHSLGGAVSSLLGLTYGLPVVTYEAVPEAMAATRLGLPVPPGAHHALHQARKNTGAFHFGHTADPVYIGTCHGATASCSFAGYAMESACHTGQECVYDVVADKGWRVGIGTHRIRSVIDDVIKKYDEVPKCESTPECRDCANWKMYESNGTESTTTSSSSTTSTSRTRTETCKTPGWWGCLDESTTTDGSTSTSSTSTSSTSTCETPGWFGCNDKTTTTDTATEGSAIPSSATPTETPSSTCKTPGRFWGCKDEVTSTVPPSAGHAITEAPRVTPAPPSPSETSSTTECKRRHWLGWCQQWEGAGGDDDDEWEPEEI